MVHVGKAGLSSAECQLPRSRQINQELLGRSAGRGSREGLSLWRDLEREKAQARGKAVSALVCWNLVYMGLVWGTERHLK